MSSIIDLLTSVRALIAASPQTRIDDPVPGKVLSSPAPDRCRAIRAERRMADLKPRHDGGSLRPNRQAGDRPRSQHNHESRLIMTSGHLGNQTILTDATTLPPMPWHGPHPVHQLNRATCYLEIWQTLNAFRITYRSSTEFGCHQISKAPRRSSILLEIQRKISQI